MSDAQDIQTAELLIEGYIGDGEPFPESMSTAEILAEMQEYMEREDYIDLLACGEWAIGIALSRVRRTADLVG